MRHTPFLPNPRMPLRDALRGAASLADATDAALGPTARLLPEPLRSRLEAAMQSLRSTGGRLMAAPVDPAQIAGAAEYVAGRNTDRAAAERCAIIVGYAWEHLRLATGGHRLLLSETLIAARLMRRAPDPAGLTPAQHAAALLHDLFTAGAIGRAPGVFAQHGSGESAEIELALIAIAVWLLSARCDSLEEEDKLLDLALALVKATRSEAQAALRDRDALALFLEKAAAHL